MILEDKNIVVPKTLAEFEVWESGDGFKYEWNDGELIQFAGMNKNQLYIYNALLDLFIEKGYNEAGILVSEYDTRLSGIQLRRPDIAYLTRNQVRLGKDGVDVIPDFVIEIISGTDNINRVEEKITEYFKAGVKVVWNIMPDQQLVYVYNSRKSVKICSENDICSASLVLKDFEISVNAIFNSL
jgi:Uma2 family endonuclease